MIKSITTIVESQEEFNELILSEKGNILLTTLNSLVKSYKLNNLQSKTITIGKWEQSFVSIDIEEVEFQGYKIIFK